MKWTASGGE